eukprot:1143693-Pelagomonas_calceolata.AAC.1
MRMCGSRNAVKLEHTASLQDSKRGPEDAEQQCHSFAMLDGKSDATCVLASELRRDTACALVIELAILLSGKVRQFVRLWPGPASDVPGSVTPCSVSTLSGAKVLRQMSQAARRHALHAEVTKNEQVPSDDDSESEEARLQVRAPPNCAP